MNSKKNILFIISSIKLGGGAERVATKLASIFSHDEDFKTQLLTFYDFYEKKYKCEAEYFSLREIPQKTFLGKVRKALRKRLWGIYRHCKQHSIDTAISFLAEASLFTLIASFLPGNNAKIIVSVRTNPLHRSRSYKAIYRYFYPFADKVVAVSKGIQKILEDEFGLDNVVTIYNPVDIEEMKEQAKDPIPAEHQHFFDGDGPFFINIGRMAKEKGQWHLIRAFSEVVKDKPEARLIILGDGELRPKIEKLARDCGLDQKVHMVRNVSNVFPYLEASDCFVFTSLWEGLPNALLEAVSLRLPVISTDCKTGPREIIAPNISVDQKINFPYENNGNLLISELSEEETWLNTQEKKLTVREDMLRESMLKFTNYKKKRSGLGNEDIFNTSKIVNKWKALIENVA